MIRRRSAGIFAGAILACSACAHNATQAGSIDLNGAPAATAPSTQPTASAPPTTQQDANHFPTPQELVSKIKAMQDKDQQTPKIAYFDLSQPLIEKPADFSFFAADAEAFTLHDLIDRLLAARDDKDIKGVLLTLGDPQINLSQAQELRDTLLELNKAGKKTFVYADSYDTPTYVAATGANEICMLGGGDIMMPGVGLETMFAKGLLDKLGVEADYVQIGQYKGADEEFTRTEPSDQLTGELNKLADGLYEQIIDGICAHRNLSADLVKSLIDQSIISGQQTKDAGLVDDLVDIDGLRDLISQRLGVKEINLVSDYGEAARPTLDLSNPFSLLKTLSTKPPEEDKPTIALVYADGVIVDGPSGGGLFSQSSNIGSEDIREAMRVANRDDNVKAVVIRINSPGGSALASEVMWQAVRRVANNKPVIISVGSMAASGGYYLASSGDYIFADPTAIVGSIGVVGGKFVLKGLYDKVGISTADFLRGKNADLFSSDIPWSDTQRDQITHWMHDTYVQFTQRVMTTRKGKIKEIADVAQGRIFLAGQAKDLGMVDAIGGENAALQYAADQAHLTAGNYAVRVLPAPRTLADILGGGGADNNFDGKSPIGTNASIGADAVASQAQSMLGAAVAALPESAQRMLGEELTVMQLMRKSPVMLVAPIVVDVK